MLLTIDYELSKLQIYDIVYITESLSIAVFIWKNSSRTHDLSSFRFLVSLTALGISSISQSGSYNNQIVVGYFCIICDIVTVCVAAENGCIPQIFLSENVANFLPLVLCIVSLASF